MRALDIVVHASIEPDPYPNVVIEGMAAGRPVIASKLGGPLEMIEHMSNGVLIEPNKPDLLADSIYSLIENSEFGLSLGNEAKKTAFSKWSIENHMEQIERVYDRLLYMKNRIPGRNQ
jgi:glycosyltransferase involved in cell wall biosynthesis